ncbi:LysR family transcriptional regulator [Candidatus Terasakiella magnetica]|uniref:LysR family transcriptional regulator n=1 Tax=Candidatus Terasakiella magnetica TaxID=1867952 RepID=A0A1C3RIR7_9PROT|nr:LysR family transcriptional regulator [Candidatus Terasakiella magnetica]SCA57163.1 LysR family transcriptional regulator [Candidatus Terasakiella magnetica]
MDLKQLRSFLHVAETGSLSKAAKRLNVTQPALSRQIRLLEEDAGVALFIRTGRGVLLSEAGALLEGRARVLSEEMERLKMDMTAFAGTVQGEVRLGLPPSVGLVLAGPVIERFRADYPNVRLRVTQLLSGALQDALLEGRMDIGVLFEGNVSSQLHSEPLWSEQLYFITAPTQPWASRKEVTLEECLEQPFILPGTKHGLRDLLDKEAAKIGKAINVVVEAESLAIQTELVCRALGSTILSYEACKSHVEAGRLIALPLVNPTVERVSTLVWSKDYPLTMAAQAMSEVIRESAAKVFTPL